MSLKLTFIGSVLLEEGTVRSLVEENGVIKGVTYKNSSGQETTASAHLLLYATVVTRIFVAL